jgi:hypothetical protein
LLTVNGGPKKKVEEIKARLKEEAESDSK